MTAGADSPFERLSKTPSGVKLGPIELIGDGLARNFVLEIGQGRFHGFVVRKGSSVHGYVDLCPHMNLPLAQKLDDYLTPDRQLIVCSWHGALFEVAEGACVGGPCVGQKLLSWPVTVINGFIVTI